MILILLSVPLPVLHKLNNTKVCKIMLGSDEVSTEKISNISDVYNITLIA